jgi:hypothetical protein
MKTQEKIKQLEQEVETLWHVLDDERLWSPRIIQELHKRSMSARLLRAKGKLKTAEEVFAGIREN